MDTAIAEVLDFNHRLKPPSYAERINALVDAAFIAEAAARPPRGYLGGSRLGDPCSRRLQYEYLDVPKDEGTGFTGLQLRVFAAGHAFEDLAIAWLRKAGFDLRTRNRAGEQFGFSAAGGRIQGHIDGIILTGPGGFDCPALWECKSANAKSWREMVKRGVAIAKPTYAAQVALYQAYMGLTEEPALLTAVNKDTSELWHEAVPFAPELAQAASDQAVRILQASEAGEWLPRVAVGPDHPECARCPWRRKCWA
jgi:hypothetical protein